MLSDLCLEEHTRRVRLCFLRPDRNDGESRRRLPRARSLAVCLQCRQFRVAHPGRPIPGARERFPAGARLSAGATFRVADRRQLVCRRTVRHGLKTVSIEKPTFVPGHRKLTIAEAASGAPPGAKVNTHPLYRIPFLSALPVCLVSPLLGTALGAVEEFVNLCGVRVTRGAVAGGGNRLSEFFPVQSRVAEASALADAARLLINRNTAEVERVAMLGQTLSVDQRIRNRRDHAFAARLAKDAVEAVFSAVGGGGLALDQPIQRMWRDSNAIVRHITLNWDAVSSMVGQHLLGLTPKGQY